MEDLTRTDQRRIRPDHSRVGGVPAWPGVGDLGGTGVGAETTRRDQPQRVAWGNGDGGTAGAGGGGSLRTGRRGRADGIRRCRRPWQGERRCRSVVGGPAHARDRPRGRLGSGRRGGRHVAGSGGLAPATAGARTTESPAAPARTRSRAAGNMPSAVRRANPPNTPGSRATLAASSPMAIHRATHHRAAADSSTATPSTLTRPDQARGAATSRARAGQLGDSSASTATVDPVMTVQDVHRFMLTPLTFIYICLYL